MAEKAKERKHSPIAVDEFRTLAKFVGQFCKRYDVTLAPFMQVRHRILISHIRCLYFCQKTEMKKIFNDIELKHIHMLIMLIMSS